MERAPLPPHERTWRHPSEIGQKTVEVDRGSGHRFVALATGALAVALIAALVVTVTPSGSADAPIAVSATTSPPVRESIRADASTAIAAAGTIRSIRFVEATAIPRAIANVPAAAYLSTDLSDPQAVLPDLHDQVLVVTDQYAYPVAWSDVARLDVAGDAVVIRSDGAIVARFSDGRLIVSYDSLIGSALAAD